MVSLHKKILTVITVLYFAAMLVLSLTAERIHNASLPRVKLIKPPKYMFHYEYELENGEKTTGSIERTAIMKEMPEFGIYTVYSTEKNGTERYYARKLDVVTGQEKDDFIEVISGIGYMDRIIENVDENITDNCEVIIIG